MCILAARGKASALRAGALPQLDALAARSRSDGLRGVAAAAAALLRAPASPAQGSVYLGSFYAWPSIRARS